MYISPIYCPRSSLVSMILKVDYTLTGFCPNPPRPRKNQSRTPAMQARFTCDKLILLRFMETKGMFSKRPGDTYISYIYSKILNIFQKW